MGVPLLAGCKGFWDPIGGSNFALSNSGSITVSPGATSGNTSTITVTPSDSFTGTVALTCAVTTSISGGTSAPTCSLSPTSASITSTTAVTSTLTATTTSSTTTGAYQITVTGTSGSVSETTSVCVEVTSSSGTCSSTASSSGGFYILNAATIAGFSIKAGVLTPMSGSPTALPTGVTPWAMAIDPTGSFLYVSTNVGIYLYTIGSGGSLTLYSPIPVIGDITAYAIQVDTSGQWLLDASNPVGVPMLYAYPINPTTGVLTLASGYNPPNVTLQSTGSVSPRGIAISPDNTLVAVAVGTATQTFTFAAGHGNTGTTSPFTGTVYTTPAKGTAVSVAFGPGTSFLYIGETGIFNSNSNSGGLRIIPINSHVVGSDSSGPYQSGGTGPHSILAAPNGYVYVANWVGSGTGNITAFLLNTSSGPSLSVQSNAVATGAEPYGLVEDSTDSYVLAVSNGGSPLFDAYTFDANTTGQLDLSFTGSTGSSPIAIVAVP
jgi:6-phosphogluconolactonase (cycloisomerase 2 family)